MGGKSSKALPLAKRKSLNIALAAKVYEKNGMSTAQDKPKPTKKK